MENLQLVCIQHCECWAKTSTLPGSPLPEVYTASHPTHVRSTYSITLPSTNLPDSRRDNGKSVGPSVMISSAEMVACKDG